MMKKTTLLMLAMGFVGSMFGQQLQTTTNSYPATGKPANVNWPAFKQKFAQNGNRTTESYWLNYGITMDNLNGGLGEVNANYLCTDSLMLGEFGAGNYSAIWLHNIGDVLDVYADNFQMQDGIAWNNWNSYTVDSMSILYLYERNHPNTSIVDTLVVELYTNATAANMPTYYFTGMAADYGSDTLYFKAIRYLYMSNSVNATGKTVIKIPLTAADTASALLGEKFWAVNMSVPGGRLVGSSITFKPGYSYALGDTIATKNAFFFASIEENGASTFPTYVYCPNSANPNCDWNSSHIVPTEVRYNQNANWNGFFIPAYAYTDPFAFEHHLITYKVTSLNVGVQEEIPANVGLSQNVPNPATGETTIRYTLENGGDVQLDIFDVTGKVVMSFDQGTQAGGSYQINFNTSNLEAGVYFYTLNVDGQKVTRRMVVAD